MITHFLTGGPHDRRPAPAPLSAPLSPRDARDTDWHQCSSQHYDGSLPSTFDPTLVSLTPHTMYLRFLLDPHSCRPCSWGSLQSTARVPASPHRLMHVCHDRHATLLLVNTGPVDVSFLPACRGNATAASPCTRLITTDTSPSLRKPQPS